LVLIESPLEATWASQKRRLQRRGNLVLTVDARAKIGWFRRIRNGINKELFLVSLRYNPVVKGALSGRLKFKRRQQPSFASEARGIKICIIKRNWIQGITKVD